LNRAVFLDRDGVINRALMRDGHPFSPSNIEEFEWVEGIQDVAGELYSAGFQLFCVTNQPDVGRGLQGLSVVEALHKRVKDEMPVEKIYACYHDGVSDCCCRKPKPGLILQAAADFTIDLKES
jgi:D-glycero-D-manno-heptose 1,7-bisphosphate phosphatase